MANVYNRRAMAHDNHFQPRMRALGRPGEGGRVLLTLACAFAVIYGMREARDLLVPILMAAFLATISYSITVALRRYLRFPHWLAVIFTVLADGGVIFGVFSLLRFLAADMKETLQGDLIERFSAKYADVMCMLDEWGVGEQARQIASKPQDIIDTHQIVSFSQTVAAQIVSLTSITTLVLVLMTFFLAEAPLFRRNYEHLPNSSEGKSKMIDALQGIQRYLLIKTLASLGNGLLAWWLCAVMDVPFAFLWGVFVFVLNYIPTIGSIVAAIPPILLALLFGGWGDAIIVAAGYLFIDFIIGNGLEPLFLGKEFGIATSVVLLSVLFWGWVLGPCGMFLAVPITVLIKLALENSRDLNWVALLIDDGTSYSSSHGSVPPRESGTPAGTEQNVNH